jgi:TAG lipase/steryl ester hydrolase/phospholipase A2/LPA acyltransferase
MQGDSRKMKSAEDYEQWRSRAEAVADRIGADTWRANPSSSVYDAALLCEHTEELTRTRQTRRANALVPLLREALYRHLGELADPRLYAVTPLGTKHVVEAFYAEALACIEYLADPDETGLDPAFTLAGFRRAAHIFGRSALMLSGGATLGFFHLGVVKALFEHGLLPDVLSGASMGALIACGTGVRTNAELTALFANPRVIRTDAVKRLPPKRAASERAVYDPARLEEVVAHNCGDYTFQEAYAHSGRTVSISVSPTRERQKPRVLCHYTTPDVLMTSAAVASASIPGAFPGATLRQRLPSGETVAYMGTETWIDGSLKGDLPMRRLSRLHNVNHFIVSQVNPHVAPVGRVTGKRGVVPFVSGAIVSSVRAQVVHQLELARSFTQSTPLYGPIDLAHSLAGQAYGGDIDIYPRFRPAALLRAMSNISHKELETHILEGERAAWPLLARVRDQTCVSRALDTAIRQLEMRT